MSEWVALSRSEHAGQYYRPRAGYHFAAEQAVLPVLLAELPRLVPQNVLAFVREEGESARSLVPVALATLDGQRNLYVNADGRWLGSYVPAVLRGYPFRLLPTAAGERTLCLASEHLCAGSEAGAMPLFDEQGEPAPALAQTLDFLQQCAVNRQATLAAAAALDAAGVIEPWPLKVKAEQASEPTELGGLLRVSEPALNALPADAFAALREGGALALAYSQMLSSHQMSQLGERAKLRAAQLAQQQAAGTVDVEAIFGESDEELSFG